MSSQEKESGFEIYSALARLPMLAEVREKAKSRIPLTSERERIVCNDVMRYNAT
jgi:hypothetical protein